MTRNVALAPLSLIWKYCTPLAQVDRLRCLTIHYLNQMEPFSRCGDLLVELRGIEPLTS